MARMALDRSAEKARILLTWKTEMSDHCTIGAKGLIPELLEKSQPRQLNSKFVDRKMRSKKQHREVIHLLFVFFEMGLDHQGGPANE
jgi:hypothetical protein